MHEFPFFGRKSTGMNISILHHCNTRVAGLNITRKIIRIEYKNNFKLPDFPGLPSLCSRTVLMKTSNRPTRSMGPAMCSGWNWTLGNREIKKMDVMADIPLKENCRFSTKQEDLGFNIQHFFTAICNKYNGLPTPFIHSCSIFVNINSKQLVIVPCKYSKKFSSKEYS